MEKIKAKVEQVLHKDKDTTHTTGAHSTGAHGTTGNTYGSDPTGPHDSRMANKADPRVDSDQYGSAGNYGNTTHSTGHTTGGYGSDPTGPHDSRMANKADPRVDSDQYGSAGNYGSTTHSTGLGHSTGHSTTGGYGSDPTGPHDSRMANKADPRVDSDQYGSAGNYGSTNQGSTQHSASMGVGYGAGHSNPGAYGSDPTGPHDNRTANKLDPRVDSDKYGSAGNYGNTTHNTGHTTGGYGSDPTGPHSSHLGNQADPRVDSDRYGGAGNTASAGGFGNPGPAPNTAGPHKSDALNKADPRVDSDMDGSKTYMGNKTQGY